MNKETINEIEAQVIGKALACDKTINIISFWRNAGKYALAASNEFSIPIDELSERCAHKIIAAMEDELIETSAYLNIDVPSRVEDSKENAIGTNRCNPFPF